MAILINGLLKGRLGDKIYYIKKGRNYTRPVRKVTQHTPAQLARQQLFAKAGNICKALYKEINENITQLERHLAYPRLMSCMLHLVRGLNTNVLKKGNCDVWFCKCRFNNSDPVSDRWMIKTELIHAEDGRLQLTIPAYNPHRELKAPAHTSAIRCRILAAGCSVADGSSTGSFTTVLTIDYTDHEIPAQAIDIAMPTPADSLILLCMSLEYVLHGRATETINTNPRYMPSGVTAAILV